MVISGATGALAAFINGVLEPTQEKGLDGRVLYRKRGNPGMIMEHFGGKWEVKHVSHKGMDNCWAKVEGGCAAEACTSRPWKVWDGKAYDDAPLVKMVAEAEVRSCCMPSCAFLTLQPPSAPPTAFPPTDA